jgi:prepilin-type N-terminal cleavage/methylation domain-containing protein
MRVLIMTLTYQGPPLARARDERGFTILETMVALSILAVALLGMAGIMATGLSRMSDTPIDLVARQKVSEAIESVYAARDTRKLTWAQIRNVANGGIFVAGAQPMRTVGNDGLVNTADDGAVETLVEPGPDGRLGTADDLTTILSNMTRQVTITDVSAQLRQLTVTVVLRTGRGLRTYTVTTLISSYA